MISFMKLDIIKDQVVQKYSGVIIYSLDVQTQNTHRNMRQPIRQPFFLLDVSYGLRLPPRFSSCLVFYSFSNLFLPVLGGFSQLQILKSVHTKTNLWFRLIEIKYMLFEYFWLIGHYLYIPEMVVVNVTLVVGVCVTMLLSSFPTG